MPCDKFSAKRQNERQSSIDVASNAPPKSPVSSSQDEVVPHIIIRSPRPQLAEFVSRAAKRLFQHYPGLSRPAPEMPEGPSLTQLRVRQESWQRIGGESPCVYRKLNPNVL